MNVKTHTYRNDYKYWYDKGTKSWWAAKFRTTNGHQLTNALFGYTKEDVIAEIEREIESNEQV